MTDHLTVAMLDDERERRDVMWQMAKEIVLMGERIERQHMLLGEIARRLEQNAHRTLGSGYDEPIAAIPSSTSHESSVDVEVKLEGELRQMREELERERELVDRLRRAKLDIERRATVAETQLQERGRGA